MEWRELFEENVLNEAEEEVRGSAVQDLSVEENRITARVADTEEFQVEIRVAEDAVAEMKCSCPDAEKAADAGIWPR